MATTNRTDIYEMVTDRIIGLLNKGLVPWHKPWSDARGEGRGVPRNLKSGKAYRGINVFLLGCAGFSSPYFVTFKQALELGGCVRKGEKGMPVVFWKRLSVEDEKTHEKKVIPLLRYFTVFNVEQCDGLKVPAAEKQPEFNPIAAAEEAVKSYENPPSITHAGQKAFYSPGSDAVTMPPKMSFDSPAHYYGTLFHELGHSTGHKSRLAREGIVNGGGFGSHLYSKEELVAEMTAAMLCGVTGIDASGLLDNSAAYVASWLEVFKGDRKLLVQAAAQAQKAADQILGVRWPAEGESDETAANDNEDRAAQPHERAA